MVKIHDIFSQNCSNGQISWYWLKRKFAIFAIVIGGFLGFLFLGGSAADGFKDKEVTKMGCSGIICVIVGIILLVGMCSH
jgi:hypothetical protein